MALWLGGHPEVQMQFQMSVAFRRDGRDLSRTSFQVTGVEAVSKGTGSVVIPLKPIAMRKDGAMQAHVVRALQRLPETYTEQILRLGHCTGHEAAHLLQLRAEAGVNKDVLPEATAKVSRITIDGQTWTHTGP